MKLRNFHYINKKLLDDYIAAIDGYVYEEETQKLMKQIKRLPVRKQVLLA